MFLGSSRVAGECSIMSPFTPVTPFVMLEFFHSVNNNNKHIDAYLHELFPPLFDQQ